MRLAPLTLLIIIYYFIIFTLWRELYHTQQKALGQEIPSLNSLLLL